MRTRFLHDEFELDVSDLELSWTEENTWFKDDFFLSSTFPFEMDYSRVPFFEKFKHDNLAISDVYFQGRLEKDGKIEDAILEVDEAGDKIRLTIRYGTEALPNWTKKLSELELDVVLPGGGDMEAHAQTIISKTYPETNYNFPAVHSKYYEGAPMFDAFQGTINKRVNGNFIGNIADGSSTLNKNIVYPFPYHLYVLKSAVEDAGYTLHGDVLTDPDLIDLIIVPPKPLTNFEGIPLPVEWIVGQESRTSVEIHGFTVIETWLNESELNHRGYFNLQGIMNDEVVWAKIKLNGEIILNYHWDLMPLNFNFWFFTTETENELVFEALSIGNGITGPYVMDSILTTLYLTDENGEMLPFLANFSNIQLAAKLPDMTVGDFFKFHKRLKNYDFDLRNGNEIWMNLVQNEVLESNVVDISEFEPPVKTKKYEQAKAYLLQYEGEYDDYKYTKILADRNGYQINDFAKPADLTEININGLPLPIETQSGIKTAVQITDDQSKLLLVKYPGLADGENWTRETPNLDCLQLYLHHWQQWLNFMIHSVRFLWTVVSHPNNLMKIARKSKLYGFNNLFFVFTLNRRRKKNIEEVEIEAYSSKV